MKSQLTKYLAEIGRRGGKRKSTRQQETRQANARKAADARRIVDEFSHLPRLERYKARKAKRKLLEMKNNA